MSESQQCQRTVTVELENGLHLRPLSQIARAAQEFDADVRIRRDDAAVDAKSVLDLMTLSATRGTTLQLEAVGSDATEAVDRLVGLFESGFPVEDSQNE